MLWFSSKWAWLILIVFLVASCTDNSIDLLGDWRVRDKYQSAVYRISKEDGVLKGEVLHYNDGTSKYTKANGQAARYVFTQLTYDAGSYVDGVSGATSSSAPEGYKKTSKNIEITIISEDTLAVKHFVQDKFTQEYWTRVRGNEESGITQ